MLSLVLLLRAALHSTQLIVGSNNSPVRGMNEAPDAASNDDRINNSCISCTARKPRVLREQWKTEEPGYTNK